MNYREVAIEDDKTIAASGTETIDLNVTDPITELIIRYKVKNSTSVLDNEPPGKQITKIELVDGGQVFWSLSGQEAIAAACYDKGKYIQCWYNESLSENQRVNIPIMFGRYVGDPVYAFDPRKLLNPQLKITWSSQSGYLTTDQTLGLTARVMEDVATPSQMLCWKTIESFTSASSGVRKVDLPVDYPYRRLGFRIYLSDADMYWLVTHFKLDCDVGKLIPFDLDRREFENVLKQAFGPFQYTKMDRYTHGEAKQAWMAGDVFTVATAGIISCIVQAWGSGEHYYTAYIQDNDGTTMTDQRVRTQVTGYFPENTYCYQFGQKDEPETWFPASRYGEVAFKITQEVGDGAASVILQQPRTY